MKLISTNPYTQEIIQEYETINALEIQEKIAKAHSYYISQPFNIAKRKDILLKVASELSIQKENLAQLITSEMGKVIKESRAEIEKCITVCHYYAENAEDYLKDEELEGGDFKAYKKYCPLGVVLAVMPWNFPFWQVFRFAAPNFMSGNAMLLKHASNVSGCALAIQKLFDKFCPENPFTTLLIPSSHVSGVLEDNRVQAVTLTGSEYAGSMVAAKASSEIKKSVLELGGSDPFIVCGDADIDRAVESAIASRFLNCGQSCIGAKRFIVHVSVYDEFLLKFKLRIQELKVGDPQLEETDIGPLADYRFKNELEDQIKNCVQLGGVLFGGESLRGALITPGFLSKIDNSARVFKEEIFGPIASFYTFNSIEEAIEIANCTPFGLASSVWVKDENNVQLLIDNLDCGAVFVNEMVKSDPRLPFGGVKKSGYGRELAREGMLEFMNVKTVVRH